MRNLVLHLKSCYFREIKEGRKRFEYRLVKPYWQKRLVGRTYDRVVFWDAYKPHSPDTVIVSAWRGYEIQTIQHEHFGPAPVKVFAIRVYDAAPLIDPEKDKEDERLLRRNGLIR